MPWLRSDDDPGDPEARIDAAGRPSPWSGDESADLHVPPGEGPDVPGDLGGYGNEEIDRAIRRAVARALAEDLGDAGDVTSAATIPAGTTGTAELVARARGVISGLDVFVATCEQLDGRIDIHLEVAEGEAVDAGQRLATLSGPLRSMLAAERSALNLLGHLSGIATRTAAFVARVEGTGVILRDTRKTLPGLRLLEKRAVRAGGGANHRMGLYDALLVKDNHVAAAGSVAGAVTAALAGADGRHVQVEVATLGELEEAIRAGATDILLDNMTPDEVRQAVVRARGRASLEASGTITLDTVRAYAETGVHRLAIGGLTHSAPWLDIALDVVTDPVEHPGWTAPPVWSNEEATTDAPPAPAGTADDPETGGLFAWRERQGSD